MAESPLERLVGTWEFEPFVEGRSMGRGRVTFQWIEDGAFLLERSHADWTDPGWVENAPVSTQSVMGIDDTTFEVTQLYADDRGVFRIYHGRVTDDEWRLKRAAPDFHQRFVGAFRDDGRTIEAVGVVTRRHLVGARLPDHLPQDQLITIKERTVTATATAPTTETLEVHAKLLDVVGEG